jgi:hypothetical protein
VNDVIWRRVLRAGHAPGRVMAGGSAIVLSFAGLYFLLCIANTRVADIVFHSPQGGFSSITKDILEYPHNDGTVQFESTSAGVGLLARRCVYFSIVTFTTLGYGDYQPVGRAQWLAMLESACGVLLICMLTASLINRRLVPIDQAAE